MEYALVNIVMGDIADIEKKKSMGISNLILGSRGLPIRQKEGGINQEVIFRSSKATTKHAARDLLLTKVVSGVWVDKKVQSRDIERQHCASHYFY